MALVSVAVFNKENEVICSKDFQQYQNSENIPLDDPFGLFHQQQQSCSIRHEFIYHSAIDRLDDIFQIKRNTTDNSMWIGLVLPIDELRVYGYVINSKVKFMAILVDSYSFSIHEQQRESELKSFFASLHTLYVEYTMNPFNECEKITSLSCIKSKRFDDGISRLVHVLNQQGG